MKIRTHDLLIKYTCQLSVISKSYYKVEVKLSWEYQSLGWSLTNYKPKDFRFKN